MKLILAIVCFLLLAGAIAYAGLVIAQSILVSHQMEIRVEPADEEGNDEEADDSEQENGSDDDNAAEKIIRLEIVNNPPSHRAFKANQIHGEFDIVVQNTGNQDVSGSWVAQACLRGEHGSDDECVNPGMEILFEPRAMSFPVGATRTTAVTVAYKTLTGQVGSYDVTLTLQQTN